MLGPWSQTEFDRAFALLSAGWKPKDIGAAIGRSETAVRVKFIKAGYSSSRVLEAAPADFTPSVTAPPPSSIAVPCEASNAMPSCAKEALESEADRLLEGRESGLRSRRERALILERAQRERLLEIFRDSLRDCRFDFSAPPSCSILPSEGPFHSALLLVSDAHVGKVCSREETEGRAVYNPAHFVARLALLEKEVIRLLKHGPPLDELVVLFLGDIVEGALDHGAEREESMLISRQFSLAVALFSQFLTRIASVVPSLRVYGCSGNHGRWPGQRRPPTVGRESNLDGLVYRAIEAVLAAANVQNVRFHLSDAPRQSIRIKSTLVAAAHGDEIRGGEFFTGGIKREVYNAVLRGARDGEIPDLWVTGDKHVPQSLSIGFGQHVINGTFVGEDAFGLRFAPAVASQTLMWICPRRGKMLQSDIRLDGARLPDPLPYQLAPALQQIVKNYGQINTDSESDDR